MLDGGSRSYPGKGRRTSRKIWRALKKHHQQMRPHQQDIKYGNYVFPLHFCVLCAEIFDSRAMIYDSHMYNLS